MRLHHYQWETFNLKANRRFHYCCSRHTRLGARDARRLSGYYHQQITIVFSFFFFDDDDSFKQYQQWRITYFVKSYASCCVVLVKNLGGDFRARLRQPVGFSE